MAHGLEGQQVVFAEDSRNDDSALSVLRQKGVHQKSRGSAVAVSEWMSLAHHEHREERSLHRLFEQRHH
jgi:hypothetical protein